MMTRDAKIGLLVGLAFILIVGILLSEHITTATMPQQAELAVAGDRVRRATGAPVAPAPVIEKVTVNENPQPKQVVATRDQLDSPQLPATARIELGQPRDGQIKVIRVDAPNDPIASATEVTPMLAATASTPTTITPTTVNPVNNIAHPLQDAARAGGMELVNVTTVPDTKPTDAKRAALPPIAHGSKVKEYVAQPGDSLSKIASRQLGANTPANQQAIIALNPSLQKDNNRILVGAKYLIPADAWAAALGVDSASEPVADKVKPAAAKAEPAATKAEAKADAKSDTVIYVVKAGDSLWKIADREVGSAGAMATIKTLNADVLGESETVKVGMKLKLPKKN